MNQNSDGLMPLSCGQLLGYGQDRLAGGQDVPQAGQRAIDGLRHCHVRQVSSICIRFYLQECPTCSIGSFMIAKPVPGAAVYSATKGAVKAFNQAVAKENAKAGIRINTVNPGEHAAPGRWLQLTREQLL